MTKPPLGPKSAPPRRALTLRDVSERSGVSEMTVSRVLRARGDVSEGTREKVLQAARDLGYVPNKIAGALASQRVNLVGVIIPSLSNQVFPEVLQGISDELDGSGLQPVVGVTHYSASREEAVLYEMLSWRPSGIVIAGLEHSDTTRKMLAAAGVPVVEVMDVDGDPVDSAVGISHGKAGRLMAERILAAGYRRIGFLGTKMPDDHRARKRMEGFEAGLAEAGVTLEDRASYDGGSALLKGREMTEAMLTRSPQLDFLYYSNDMIAAGGLLWCLERGIDIPQQLGLAGFNAVELIAGLPRRLATMDSQRREIGRQAAQIITSQAAGKVVELNPSFVAGDTIRQS